MPVLTGALGLSCIVGYHKTLISMSLLKSQEEQSMITYVIYLSKQSKSSRISSASNKKKTAMIYLFSILVKLQGTTTLMSKLFQCSTKTLNQI